MKNFFTILFLVVAAILINGCNPAKRAAKQAEQFAQVVDQYNAEHPQHIDTITKYLPGAIINRPYPVFMVDSNRIAYLRDSLKNAFAKKYQLDQADCSRQVTEAFNTGYNQAAFDCNAKIPPLRAPDTAQRTLYPYELINGLNRANNTLQGKIGALEEQHKQDKNWIWYFIASVVINFILLILLLKPKKLL